MKHGVDATKNDNLDAKSENVSNVNEIHIGVV